MANWWNYKQAGELPPEVVERMWRALAHIGECASIKHPGHVDFMNKDAIAELALSALPSDEDKPRSEAA
jgi:hypothetical protein